MLEKYENPTITIVENPPELSGFLKATSDAEMSAHAERLAENYLCIRNGGFAPLSPLEICAAHGYRLQVDFLLTNGEFSPTILESALKLASNSHKAATTYFIKQKRELAGQPPTPARELDELVFVGANRNRFLTGECTSATTTNNPDLQVEMKGRLV